MCIVCIQSRSDWSRGQGEGHGNRRALVGVAATPGLVIALGAQGGIRVGIRSRGRSRAHPER